MRHDRSMSEKFQSVGHVQSIGHVRTMTAYTYFVIYVNTKFRIFGITLVLIMNCNNYLLNA